MYSRYEEKVSSEMVDYVEDSCRTWANILENFIPGEVYNVGGRPEWEHDISWYASKIAESLGKPSSLIRLN